MKRMDLEDGNNYTNNLLSVFLGSFSFEFSRTLLWVFLWVILSSFGFNFLCKISNLRRLHQKKIHLKWNVLQINSEQRSHWETHKSHKSAIFENFWKNLSSVLIQPITSKTRFEQVTSNTYRTVTRKFLREIKMRQTLTDLLNNMSQDSGSLLFWTNILKIISTLTSFYVELFCWDNFPYNECFTGKNFLSLWGRSIYFQW